MEQVKKQPTGVKVAKIIFNVLFYLIIATLLLYSVIVIASRGNENNIPNIFGNGFLAVKSESMEGTNPDSFSKNDLIFVKILKESEKEFQVGQVVTFKDPAKRGELNTHRIVEIIGNYYRTQGDNTNEPDFYLLEAEDIVAVYTGKAKGLGGFVLFIQSQTGFALLVLLPIFLVLVYQGYKVLSAVFAIKKEKLIQQHAEEKAKAQAELEAEKERMRQELLEELKKEKK
ncbi:signal peptidase I [Acholeplasma hippikon]|uniref:Signal peptidase I n=1 Tax=Acholeplasma hippikon TaxID=264636 RepID=A0A449BLK8_9MOLU|nr:signal peptidase I [Acholeplasma hippikon]VEU83327.1 Signal peptidase I W [Acholeplasma hippikon]